MAAQRDRRPKILLQTRLLRRGAAVSEPLSTIRVARAFGPTVEGEAVVSAEGFSPRYDLDR